MSLGSIRKFRRAQHHVILSQQISAVPGLIVPVLYFAEPSGPGQETLQPLHPLTDYFVSHSAMSMTWMRDRARGVGLLYDYLRQRSPYFQAVAADSFVNVHRVALSEFQVHLVRGTVVNSPTGPVDETGLYWLPSSSSDSVINLCRAVHDFLAWLDVGGFGDRLERSATDSRDIPINGRDTIRFLYVARYRKKVSFLAHIKSTKRQRVPVDRVNIGRDTRSFTAKNHVQFPREFLVKLFREGFVSRPSGNTLRECEDITGKLATMFCGFGGTRRSESLHVWVNDVQLVDGKPTVFLHHPVLAKIKHPAHGEMTREEYLRMFCKMEPRNRVGDKFHAGWKGIKCNSAFWAPLYWLPFDGISEYFWETFQTYLLMVRPRLIRERLRRGLPDHPFLLVSAGRSNQDDEDSIGSPYTYVAHGNAWSRAIARLAAKYPEENLVEAKANGTTLHGLRHLYGGILAELKIGEREIQECMHHLSPLSSLTYTKPRNEFVDQQLSAAAEVVRLGNMEEPTRQFRNLNTMLTDIIGLTKGDF